jgi:hypothetical protein
MPLENILVNLHFLLKDIRVEHSSCDNEVDSDGIRKICVVGGGAAGLATLKVIVDTPQYQAGTWKVVAFEARDKVGGVW